MIEVNFVFKQHSFNKKLSYSILLTTACFDVSSGHH